MGMKHLALFVIMKLKEKQCSNTMYCALELKLGVFLLLTIKWITIISDSKMEKFNFQCTNSEVEGLFLPVNFICQQHFD